MSDGESRWRTALRHARDGRLAWKGPHAHSLQWLDRCDSTSTWALTHHSRWRNAELPLLVLTDLQTAGRGRGGNRWLADRGTLCFTLVEQSASYGLCPRTLPQLALIVGLAVAEAIERLCPTLQPRIKWPNDIYVADGKVAGVLVETARDASPRVAIGVGINVATEVDRLEPRLRGAARSLSEVVGEKLDRFALLEHFLARLAAQQSASRDRSAALELPQASQLRDRCYLTGHDVTLRSGKQQLRGHCVGIDDDGALRLRTGDRVLRVVSGEVVRTEASRAG